MPRLPSLATALIAMLMATAAYGQRPNLEPAEMISTDDGRAWMESQEERCFGKLADVLDRAGYTHHLELRWSVPDPSIVDATEALRDAMGVEVALLADGERMHAVAPFLTHGRARALVRYAESQTERPDRRMCLFARAVQEDAGMRASQRALLLGIALACFGIFGFGAWRATRRASTA